MEEEIERVAEQYPQAQQLMTHPGVGALTALAVVLTLGPVARFGRLKQVASYFGLVPKERSSGGRQRFGPMTKRGWALARFLVVQSGHLAVRKDPELRAMYYRLLHKKGPRKAKVAVGRKLLIRLFVMLRDGITYEEFCQRRKKA